MASSTAAKRMREEATCSICLALMAEPLSISCGHSYCQVCIMGFISSEGRTQGRRDMLPCPQCRSPFHRASLRPNKQLGSLIEAIKELEQAMSCDEHGEELHLFCEDEGQLLCWRCERASQHRGHATALVEDVCPGYKEKLQKAVTHLRQLEEECASQQASTAKQITKWNEEIETKRQKIQSDFRSLHSFLQLEEKSHLRRLEQEKEGTLRGLQSRQAALVSKSLELESHIQELEDRCQGSAQRLLQDVKGTLSRSWAMKLETPEAPSLEVRTVCDVSKLYFDVKRLLKSHQVSVTLDPDTAHRELILSADQRQVTRGCPRENLDASPRRFTVFPCVLGREGFTSGRHYFEVDVGEGIAWDLGVCMENVRRDIRVMRMPQTGFWAIRLCTKDGYVALTSPHTLLHLQEQPMLVGVFLDCEAGEVSFYNMTTASHIFTFPKASSSAPLRPYFQVYRCSPLFLPAPED